MTDMPNRPRLRWLVWAVALLLLAMSALLSLLPEMIRFGAMHWLRDHGAATATIEDIDLNLFSGSMTLIGLDAGDGVRVKRVSLHLDWAPLWHRTLLIRSLYLHGGQLSVHQDAQGQWQCGDIRFDSAAGADAVDAGSSRWRIAPVDVHLSQVDLHVDGVVADQPLTLALPLDLMMVHLQGRDESGEHMSLRFQTGPVALVAAGYQLAYGRLDVAGQWMLSGDMAAVTLGPLQLGLAQVLLRDMNGQQLFGADAIDVRDLAYRVDDGLTAATVSMVQPTISDALSGSGSLSLARIEVKQLHAGGDRSLSVDGIALSSVRASEAHGSPASLQINGVHAGKVTLAPNGALTMAALAADGIHADVPANGDHFEVQRLQADSLAVDEKRQGALKKLLLTGISGGRQGGAEDLRLTLTALQLGQLTFNGDGEAGFKQLQADGMTAAQASGDQLALQQLRAESFALRAGQRLQLVLVQLAGLSVDRSIGKMKLLGVDEASLAGLHLDGMQKGGFSSLVVNGLQLPVEGERSPGHIARIRVERAGMDHDHYRIGLVQMGGMALQLGRSKDGAPDLPEPLVATTAAGSGHEEKAAAPVARTAPHVMINALTVDRGSTIAVHDETVSPPFAVNMTVRHMRFGTLDFSGEQAADMDVQLELDGSAEASAKGHVHLQTEPSADIVIGLKRIRLPALTGYVEPDFGKSIHTGQLDLDSRVTMANGHIEASNKLLLRSLTLGDSAQAGQKQQGFSMPLDMSLDMLRDDRGDIALDVPVSGSLDDPDINIHDIINKALLSSFSSGAMTYAALALQPYGSIIVAANLAGDMISAAAKPRLTPMLFAPREAKLSEAMNEYAGKIASLMKSKGLRLHICGVATRIEGDQAPTQPSLPAMSDDQLLQLAGERSGHVQQAIAAHGVAADQLYGCRPEIDGAKVKASPRVELLLD
ncbi:DUF748 domain-containing protein [Mariprofundus erugo]|uniref:DUF748 domain-containing protein n=1 Tax=Mariprofundus erugo TaxID=2528639 RepID=UPI0010FD8F27|nr:DUF748 domain-containing protein [Mariprofundus erugo]TLS74778.1 DUF748 domain-containing protein [Mariprofundus erugo]